jgi:hypothetical protein
MIDWLEVILVWFAAGATISVLSYFFKPLPSFDFYESVTIGGAIANASLVTLGRLNRYNVNLLSGDLSYLIPILLGLLMFAMLTKRHKWVIYYPSSIMIGTGMGMLLAESFKMVIIGNVVGVIDQVRLATTTTDVINGLIILVGFATSTAYFIYTVKQEGLMKYITVVGRLFMMAALGVTWASYMLDKTESVIALFYGVLRDTWQIFL